MNVTHGGDIFELARRRGCDWREIVDFSASINPLGPAPGVKRAIVDALDRIVHYPERDPSDLREALAAKWNVSPDQILLGNGATELIFFLARTYAGAPICLRVPVFSEFHRAFPNARLTEDVDPHRWPTQGVQVLTRPENPTGLLLEYHALRKWLRRTDHTVIADESFIEFSGAPSLADMTEERPNLLVLRSLTKFYALPGLRIGALVASKKLIRQWQTMREPWQVNVLASAAAVAALQDEDHAAKSVAFVDHERGWLAQECGLLRGVTVAQSRANFLHVRTDYPAAALRQYLLEHNLIIRDCSGWAGISEQSVRVAVRTRDENLRLLNAWRQF
jgi:threonine-phosphate decarboxylase